MIARRGGRDRETIRVIVMLLLGLLAVAGVLAALLYAGPGAGLP